MKKHAKFANRYYVSVMSGGNALLIATIFYQSELRQRKEMLLISGLATADFIFGFGSFLTFVYRAFLLATGAVSVLL
jgi:hypothetical protein